jgi:hypothetical protein
MLRLVEWYARHRYLAVLRLPQERPAVRFPSCAHIGMKQWVVKRT